MTRRKKTSCLTRPWTDCFNPFYPDFSRQAFNNRFFTKCFFLLWIFIRSNKLFLTCPVRLFIKSFSLKIELEVKRLKGWKWLCFERQGKKRFLFTFSFASFIVQLTERKSFFCVIKFQFCGFCKKWRKKKIANS